MVFVEYAIKLQKPNTEFQGRNVVYACTIFGKKFLSKRTNIFSGLLYVLRVSGMTEHGVSCDRVSLLR